MAERPVFIPGLGDSLVDERCFVFEWHPGFAAIQKKKNVSALHASAAEKGFSPLLEISSKSDERLGQRMSAFSLKVQTEELGSILLECAFQGSKVFEWGGPYTDLYHVDGRTAKKDPRIRSSGRIVEFRFGKQSFPAEPMTAFYDWLYISALFPHREYLTRLFAYQGFTDIEFNPSRSLNCQARSCAIMVSLMQRGLLEEAVKSQESFLRLHRGKVNLRGAKPTEPAAELFE